MKSGSTHTHPCEAFVDISLGSFACLVPTARVELGKSAGHVGTSILHAGFGAELSLVGANVSVDAASPAVLE